MEEVYSLSDGSQVDLSNYSDFEKINFLMENPGAKKLKGVAKSAGVMPKKKAQDSGSKQVSGSSGSQKFRLANEDDLEVMQKRGEVPPSSAYRRSNVDVNDIYGSKTNFNKDYQELKAYLGKGDYKQRLQTLSKNKKIESKEDLYTLKQNSTEHVDSINEIANLKKKIQETDSDLEHPYLYYSSKKQDPNDDFIDQNYNRSELEDLGINTEDFDGFLNKNGYKQDYLDKQQRGLYNGEGSNFATGYNYKLADELAKKRMLNMYMDNMQRRDYTKQDLNEEIEVVAGNKKEKEIVNRSLFDQNKTIAYVEKNYPNVTQKLKERDIENARLYEESKKGGSDFWSWDTPGKIGRAGWNGIIDRLDQISPVVYEKLGMTDTAEGIRLNAEQTQLSRPEDRGYAYASGKLVKYDGTDYIVDSKGQVYDKDAKIRVTDLLSKNTYEKILNDSKTAPSDWTFSGQGAATQTASVMGDMIIQAALTRGVGEFGAIATETRLALSGAQKANRFSSLLNDTSSALKMIPLQRAEGYSMVAQGALGYTQGYEETLKAARDNGITDREAFKLATSAAQRLALLYSTTGVINPQTEVAENLFGTKGIIKQAINQYTKKGEKGFIQYLDDIIKNAPKNAIEFAEEGGKEVVQENIQQAGELGANRITNVEAGKKIMNDTMSGDDFVNTSILSFISSGLISKAKLPSFHTQDENVDNLSSLSTLAKNKKEFTKIIDGLVDQKVFTVDEADNLKKDVDIYADNINKLPKTVTPETAMPIMRELDKVTKLENEKKSVDKAFHAKIDEQIAGLRQNIVDIQYESDLKVKNKAISNAIQKGVAKGVQMKTFSNSQEIESYLIEEVGMSEAKAAAYLSQPGFALNSETLKKYSQDPDSIADNSQVIVVNESKTRDAGVIQHEFLHGVLQNTLKDNPEAQKLVGNALATELQKINDSLKKKGSDERAMPEWFHQRIGQYIERDAKERGKVLARYQTSMMAAGNDSSKIAQAKAEYKNDVAALEGVVWEEALTIYSDALRRGYVTYNEGVFTKLGDVIRRVLQDLGIRDIKFNSGRDVYNFIKDYNNSVESGKWGKALTKMSNEGAKINIKPVVKSNTQETKTKEKSEFTTEAKFSLGERKSSEEIKKDINKTYDKETWSTGSNSKDENPAINRVMYDILNEYEYIIKGKAKGLGYSNLPDFSEMDFVSETQIAMIPLIRNFNKEFFQKREEYKKELEAKGLDPKSQEFKDKVEAQDEKGYQGKKGIVKENTDLNAYINSQLANKMKDALKTGNVTSKMFTDDIQGEGFKETRIQDDFGGDTGQEDTFLDESDSIFDAEQDFAEEQNALAVLLSDPKFRFVDEDGKAIDIETVPFGGFFVTEATDPTVAANRKLAKETDPNKITDLNRQLRDLARGLELQSKKDLTVEEKEELKNLKSFKSYDLSTGMMVNTFEALSIQDTPAKIISDEVGREILRSPNIETLEYRNFKERLSTLSKTMARRMTFKNGPEIESFMYDNWKLLYDVINHPVDPVTGQSSYASKKLPPRLKEQDEKGDFRKIKDISRIKFLQSFYGIDDTIRIVKTYGGLNANKELKELEEPEVSEKDGGKLRPTTYFDRRTALMELFGDVMVLQEARRLLRQPEFLSRVAERNVNLYNELKDDIIRAKVLNDMAKGKSDIVKFTLTESKYLPKPSVLLDVKYNSLKRTGENLTTGISDNILFGYDSLPESSSTIKFTLSELDNSKSQKVTSLKDFNKKYENNFKFPSNLTGNTNDITEKQKIIAKNYYIKALQYSDLTDTIPGTKLHTLKNYEEIENEVVLRVKNIIDAMKRFPAPNDDFFVDPETGEIDRDFKQNAGNPYVIKDFKDEYIEAMLQKSINENNENYIKYWTNVKNDSDFRRWEILSIRGQQAQVLEDLVSEFYDYGLDYHNGIEIKKEIKDKIDSDKNINGLKFNPFFTYLFLKDILSSRYKTNALNESSERKPFKQSEYKTTLEPLDTYIDVIIKEVYDNFSDSKLQTGLIYSLLNIKHGTNFISDWDRNKKVSVLNNREIPEDINIFKFKQNTPEMSKDDRTMNSFSLNRLAALNNKRSTDEGAWCTGQSISQAGFQLDGGDFFIGANINYIPRVAVRFDEDSSYGIGEIVGDNKNQTLKVDNFPVVVEIFSKSDLENKEQFVNIFSAMYDIFNNKGEIYLEKFNKEGKKQLLKEIKKTLKNNYFEFKLDEDNKKTLLEQIENVKSNLIKEGIIEGDESLRDIAETGSYTGLNITLDEEKDLTVIELLQSQKILTEDSIEVNRSDDGLIVVKIIDREEDTLLHEFEFPYLEEIESIEFNGVKRFIAKKLNSGYNLYLNGYVNLSFDGGFLNLKDSINFNVDVTVLLTEDATYFTLSDDNIDFNSNDLNITTDFYLDAETLEEEGSTIDISTVVNSNNIMLYGLASNVYLPKKINNIHLEVKNNESYYMPEEVMLIGAENIEKMFIYIPTKPIEIQVNREIKEINVKDFITNKIGFQDQNTSINDTIFKIQEKPTDKFIKDILNSEIGLASKNIILTGNLFYRDEKGVGQYENYSLKIKEEENKGDIIKFSLAEEENGKLSEFLEGLPFSEQWVVARDIDNAIKNSKIADGTKKTFKVPSRSKMSDKSTAYFIIQKVAEGYNDFEFTVKKNAKGPLTAKVLEAVDFKSKKYQEQLERNNNIEKTINDIIEENKGVKSEEKFSPETAKNLGKNIGKNTIFLPPEDEDFEGLLYTLASAKGEKGKEQLAFLRDNLLKPYSNAMLNLMKARQTMYKDWTDLINKKHKGISKLLKQDCGYGGYLYDQAVRVYLWKKAEYPIPGLDKKDIFNLVEKVRTDPRLRKFADDVSLLSKQANGWTEPGHNWGFGSVVGDINNIISKSNRAKYLEQWSKNVEKAFSKDNMSKIEAVYGRSYAKALKNSLDRMKTGTNRVEGSNDNFLNWLNGATAVTMFANMRSAILQTLGAINFINTSDNNILKAGAALLNVKQYTKDFFTIWNSDYLRDRRSGLMNDVAEAELAQLMNDPRNKSILDKFKAANYWILKQGYAPTRIADSFAIAIGGAGFYRNRLNTYLKSGMNEEEAKKATMSDFYDVSESSQQSADVSKISMNQASVKGRLILAFQNTPLQYSRIIKKSVIDLAKGRGSVPNNIAKILYYGALQNMMFNFLQNGLFSLLWDDEDEQKESKFDSAKIRALSGTMDTLLRGSGLQGAILATVKNIIIKWYEKSGNPNGFRDVALEATNLSPSVGIKMRALSKSYDAIEYNKDEIMYKGFSLDNKYALEALTSLTAASINFPADRLYTKTQNVSDALNSDFEAWQRVALAMGFNRWNLGLGESANAKMSSDGTLKIPELKTNELKTNELKTP